MHWLIYVEFCGKVYVYMLHLELEISFSVFHEIYQTVKVTLQPYFSFSTKVARVGEREFTWYHHL